MKKIHFRLPPKGSLEPNGPDDSLPYYYRPLIGIPFRSRFKQALSLLTPPYESILEVGYGSGILLPTLVSIGKNVSGIELESDPARVESNLKKLGVNASLSKGDISHTNYPDDSFDLVVVLSVFEHIRDFEPGVREVFRILKPNGELLVGMPRVDILMEKLFPLIGWHNAKSQHVTTYRQFLKIAYNHFELVKFAKMPSFLPSFAAYFFNMLLRKLK